MYFVDVLGGEVGQDQSACRIMNAGGDRDDACAKPTFEPLMTQISPISQSAVGRYVGNFTNRGSIRGKDGRSDELRVLGLSLVPGRGLTRHPE
jgi:hypothetical protein